MDTIRVILSNNFISVAMIIGIAIMILENRKENPHGTDHIAVIMVMLAVIVVNTAMKDWYFQSAFDPNEDYTGDIIIKLLYIRSAIEHILFPMIAYVLILLVAPATKKYIIFIPEGILIVEEIINLFGTKIIFHYDKHLNYEDDLLFLLPYSVGMLYLLLLIKYSISFIREKKLSKGFTVIFIVFLTLLECYLEATYVVVDLMDEIVALDIIVYYFYLVAIYQSEIKLNLKATDLELERSKRQLTISQIQPHFMYNSLTSIIYLCDKDTAKTKNALIDFSKFLRKNLEAMSRQNMVDISEEIEHTKVYLSLEKLRFEDELEIVFDIRDDDFMLPQLTIQPIVENAVKHGINRSESGCGTVWISTEETEDSHKIVIKDNGAGFEIESLKDLDDSHIGIFNVRKRLADECHGELIIKSAPDEGTECTILIPKE